MTNDFLTLASFAIGLIGLILAGWQMKRARTARQMYEEKCRTRCKDLVGAIRRLSRTAYQACKIKDEKLDDIIIGKTNREEAVRPLRQLSDQIHS